MRSSGDHRGVVPSAGASGGPEAGAGEDDLSGESRTEQEDRSLASGRRESSRGRRESGESEKLPVFAPGMRSRPRQCRSWPAMAVWLQRRSPAARGGWDSFRTISRCSPNDRTELLQLERRNGFCGLSVSSRRWGALSAARPAEWSLPGGCWESGEGI